MCSYNLLDPIMLRNDKNKIIMFSFTAEKMLIQNSRIGTI